VRVGKYRMTKYGSALSTWCTNADGNFLVFFERAIAGALGLFTLLVWLWPVGRMAIRKLRMAARS
jgi:hypothetical protein